MKTFQFLSVGKLFAGIALCTAVSLPAMGWAQDYPNRSVKLVVPFAPGGATDSIARLFARNLSERLGQQVVVENRPGAAGQIGMTYVINQPADGYTLALGSVDTLAMMPALKKKKPYHALNDMTAISLVASSPLIVAANSEFPGKTMADLIARAKAAPGQITYGSPGFGTSLHLGVELLQLRTDTKMLHVPFQGGSPMTQAMIAKQVDFVLISPAVIAPFVASGQAKGIAQADVKRHPLLPDVPTTAEQGITDMILTPWFGIVGPANLPRNVVDRLDSQIAEIVKNTDFQKQLVQVGAQAEYMNASRFHDYIHDEIVRWNRTVEEAKIPLQD